MLDTGHIALSWLEQNKREICELADSIWAFAELGLHEHMSSEAQRNLLSKYGFQVESGVAGMPSAFVASYGAGKPSIGFLGEFDALPGCSNHAVPERSEIVKDGPGHACGHNLLGVGSLAAAIAIKQELEASGRSATVRYYGCPAEENFGGKAFMARDGLFDDLDVCFTWHPSAINIVTGSSSLAINSMNVHFHGRTAHASGAPHHGRSALDAVEIMNIGANYLREHVIDKARIHYVITNGGRQPNVVPALASVWYYVRAPRRDEVDEIYERVLKCAEGAAIMTDTTYEVEVLDALWNVLPNRELEDTLRKAMQRAGAPCFSQAHEQFAEQISSTFPAGQREAIIREYELPAEARKKSLHHTLAERPQVDREPKGSTDVGDVSWVVPTAQFSMACYALGTAGHSWQITAQSGMGIGHEGMMAAARTLTLAGFAVMDDQSIIERAWAEFRERTEGKKYRCAIPAGVRPAFHQLEDKR